MRFVFPSETSALKQSEYGVALYWLNWVARVIALREEMHRDLGPAFDVNMPAGNWDQTLAQTAELDQAPTNPFTSFNLLMGRDRDVISQMRLYCQAFTGYQLATMSMANVRPWVRKKLPPNMDEIIALLAHPSDPAIERWNRIATVVPKNLLQPAPFKFGETGWMIDGCIVNYDSWCYLQRLALLHQGGIIAKLEEIAKTRRPRVIEIGGGYGALAHHLIGLVPSIDMSIVDLPESLAFSTVYMSICSPGVQVNFCPNFMMGDVIGGSFDLAINTCSLNEMTADQVTHYAAAISRLIGTDGVFFEQNNDSDRHGVSGLRGMLAPHFTDYARCPAEGLGPLDPGDARIWSNA